MKHFKTSMIVPTTDWDLKNKNNKIFESDYKFATKV
jgi:hypothetical protein